MRPEVVALALTASVFTALASVAQRRAAAPAPGRNGLGLHLVHYLLHRPVWFLGIASMILGFVFQVAALPRRKSEPCAADHRDRAAHRLCDHRPAPSRTGSTSVIGLQHSVWRQLLARFSPWPDLSAGMTHASGSMWVLAGISTFVLAAVLALMASVPGAQWCPPSANRKAALLGIAAAAGFGFVAAVIKELSTHFAQGPAAVFSNWSPYVLLLSGAASMFLASHAFQAGSLAASQPGLTVVDPLVASLLGVVLFGERLVLEPIVLAGELMALFLLVGSVVLLSRSPLIRGEDASQAPAQTPDDCSKAAARRRQRIGATARGRYADPTTGSAFSQRRQCSASGSRRRKPPTSLGSLERTVNSRHADIGRHERR